MNRIGRDILVGFAAIVAGCARTPMPILTDGGVPWPAYPSGEAAAVYRAVLDTLYGLTESPPVVILYDSTNLRISDCTKMGCTLVPPHRSQIERSTLKNFDLVTSSHRFPMRADFGYRLPIVLIGDRDMPELTRLGDSIQAGVRDRVRPNEMPFWVGVQRKYPGSWGRTTLTPVGFNSAHTQAMLQLYHFCGGYCSSYEDMLLKNRSGKWEVIERIPLPHTGTESLNIITIHTKDSADEYRILGPFRYLGVDAHMRREFAAREDSARRFREDSLALDRAPTRIRGTIHYAKTGLPLPYAVLIAHTPPNDSQRQITSDSAGYFVLDNPRGGTMLEVRCPGGADRPRTTLAAPGIYSHAGIDTVVDIPIPDISPCWKTPRIHRIQPGWFESAEARNASYPSGAAAQVYRVVIDAMYPPSRRAPRVVAISNTTATNCVESDDCGGPQLARLLFQGVVDSATVRSFLKEARDPTPLRATFGYRRPLALVTPEERRYLTQEGARWRDSYDNADVFWPTFKLAVPESEGILSLTRVGFNRDSTQALIEARVDSAERTGRVLQMILLAKHGSTWQIVRRHIERETTSGAMGGGKCIPTSSPRRSPKVTDLAELEGDFDVTEVETSRGLSLDVFHWHLKVSRTPEASHAGKAMRNGNAWSLKVQVIADSTKRPDPGFGAHVFRDSILTSIWLDSPPNGLDGYVNELAIRRVKNGSFFGSWQSSVSYVYQVDSEGYRMANPGGYFCAIAVSGHQ